MQHCSLAAYAPDIKQISSSNVLPCVILFLCFSVLLALRGTLGEEKAYLSAFRMFVRFALVWSVSSSSWCL